MSFDFNLLYRFWFLIILNFLSILCSLFVLYHFLFNQNLRQAMNNHVLIILLILGLIMQLIDIPFVLNYFRMGTSWTLTKSFSQFWTFMDFGCYSAQLILFAWTTIERHILIFHDRWLSTKKKRFFFHYLPIILILIYAFIYYITIVVILSCQDLNDQSPINGVPFPCIYNNPFYLSWDLLGHQIIPTIIIVIFSISLLVRVLHQKAHIRQVIQWRKQRKMTIQLLSIALLYQLLNFPWAFLQFCSTFNIPVDVDGKAFTVAYFLPYYLIDFFPFVCCGTLPELTKKLKKLFFCQERLRTVHPTAAAINSLQAAQRLRNTT